MQSFAIYLKRVALIALLAVLGWGIGTALRPDDSSLQAVPTHCNQELCVKITTPNDPDTPDFKVCMDWPNETNKGNTCTNFWDYDAGHHSCSISKCPIIA